MKRASHNAQENGKEDPSLDVVEVKIKKLGCCYRICNSTNLGPR